MDIDLVKRAQRGDTEALTSLAVALGDRFFAVSNRILGDIGLAEDATQQALLNIWRDPPSYATWPGLRRRRRAVARED